ncbi:MAG: hypothetical protein KIG62_01825 [Oscillospiraceae bacterium]|nr:hypothetical protein [Oscillospiraceae bacterium]
MKSKTGICIKSAVAGVVVGTLAFIAVNSLSRRHSIKRMTTAKAFKTIGTLLDAF